MQDNIESPDVCRLVAENLFYLYVCSWLFWQYSRIIWEERNDIQYKVLMVEGIFLVGWGGGGGGQWGITNAKTKSTMQNCLAVGV